LRAEPSVPPVGLPLPSLPAVSPDPPTGGPTDRRRPTAARPGRRGRTPLHAGRSRRRTLCATTPVQIDYCLLHCLAAQTDEHPDTPISTVEVRGTWRISGIVSQRRRPPWSTTAADSLHRASRGYPQTFGELCGDRQFCL